MQSAGETELKDPAVLGTRSSGNPYLSGIYASVTQEYTLAELEVIGVLPAELEGRYLRIGPNPVAAKPGSYHWFIGDGMIHGLALSSGRALWYRNRWIRSKAVAKALGVEPAPGPRHHFDTVNTNVVEIGGRSFALVEAGSYPVELGPTLEEQRYNPFDGTLKGSFSAHPHRDPKTGEQHAICYEGRNPRKIRHVVVDASGRVIREMPISVNHGPMIHDCAITDRFVLILDLPVTFSLKAAIAGHGFPYRWNPRHKARVGLLPRHGGKKDIIWCPVPPAYAFHVANAYDMPDGKVVLDLCAYETMFQPGAKGPDTRGRGLERWTLDPADRSVEIRTIDPAPQDFPRPDERRFGQPYRHVYTTAGVGGDTATLLYAHDLEAGTRLVHDFGPGRHPHRVRLRAETPRQRRGRRMADRLRHRPCKRNDRSCHHRCPALRGRTGGKGSNSPSGAARISWKLASR